MVFLANPVQSAIGGSAVANQAEVRISASVTSLLDSRNETTTTTTTTGKLVDAPAE